MHGHKTSHLPIRYFLALLWAHPILHISTIRVKFHSLHSRYLTKKAKGQPDLVRVISWTLHQEDMEWM